MSAALPAACWAATALPSATPAAIPALLAANWAAPAFSSTKTKLSSTSLFVSARASTRRSFSDMEFPFLLDLDRHHRPGAVVGSKRFVTEIGRASGREGVWKYVYIAM